MNLFKLGKSEILRTENFNLTVFLWVMFGLFATSAVFWVAAMAHLKPEELVRSAILGFCVCLFGSFCFAWFWGNVFANIQHDHKKKEEEESDSDWMKYLLQLYDIQVNDHKYYYPGVFQLGGVIGVGVDECKRLALYLKRKRYVRLYGNFEDTAKPPEKGKDIDIRMELTKRGIKRVKREMTNRVEVKLYP